MPSIYIDAIAKLTGQGMFPSRSEAIRVALRDFLKSELGMVEALLDMNENEGKVIVTRTVEAPAKALAKGQEKAVDMRTNKAGWGEQSTLSDDKIASIKHQLGMR